MRIKTADVIQYVSRKSWDNWILYRNRVIEIKNRERQRANRRLKNKEELLDRKNSLGVYSKEPMSQNATDSIEIHCPLCGAVLRQMAQNHDANKLGLYTCDRCRR